MRNEKSRIMEASPLAEQPSHASPGSEVLEQRVRRLEDAVAAMQDTRQLEERLVERVADRVQRPSPSASRDSTGILIETGRRLLPAAVAMMRTANDAPQAKPGNPVGRQPWLVWEVFIEARAMLRMFFDPRFHLARSARIIPLVLMGLILTSWFWLPGTALLDKVWLGSLVTKPVDLVLAFFLYKILLREAHRYQAQFPDSSSLPTS